ncbi:MAG: DegT/DnrJ/EryC1/StrS family aminotransferase [Verrucomicrobiaceae bacterium]
MTPASNPTIPLTESMLPPLERFVEELKDIWDSSRLTNAGPKLMRFEKLLKEKLGVDELLAFVNGGSALLAGVKALGIEGDVVTTPFTFAASTHVLALNGLRPVFCDVDDESMNISPAAIERAITPQTSAILGVHVFGTPCAVDEIDEIARRRGLKVIYDGAHAFGATVGRRNIAEFGDVQMFSFNATKLLTTGEGGCVVFRDPSLAPVLQRLRRWGMLDEGDVTMPGWNGMMTEMQAALGLCNLEFLDEERAARAQVVSHYLERLSTVPGIRLMAPATESTPALSYFVIRVDAARFGHDRDTLLAWLRDRGILARRYFYPLTSQFPCYAGAPGAGEGGFPVAARIVREILALPFYGRLGSEGTDRVCDAIEALHRRSN